MREVVFVKTSVDDIEAKMKQKGIEVIKAYEKKHFIARQILKAKNIINFSNIEYPYNKEIKKIRKKTILVFDAGITIDFMKWLHEIHPDKRIIFWYWNRVQTAAIKPVQLQNVEIWSYSLEDCKKYGLRYNTTFYLNNWESIKAPIEQDILFVGIDKGRAELLWGLEKEWIQLGISTKFYIVKDSWHQLKWHRKYKKEIPYSHIIKLINSSKAILDFYVDVTAGFSLRTMESLFFEKKLITNNKNIIEWEFYCPENVFVLGKDSSDCLIEFLHRPIKHFKKNEIDYYDIEQWMDRFFV